MLRKEKKATKEDLNKLQEQYKTVAKNVSGMSLAGTSGDCHCRCRNGSLVRKTSFSVLVGLIMIFVTRFIHLSNEALIVKDMPKDITK